MLKVDSDLSGIWGSAFCIQFKHLLKDDKKVDMAELMRREREELGEFLYLNYFLYLQPTGLTEWMFSNTPAQKQISCWVSDQW